MIIRENYEAMKREYSHVGSWAIWKDAGATAKSNTNDMNWTQDEDLLNKINTGFVFVGLNWSSTHGDQSDNGTIAWSNFHSGYSGQNDYKLRYALKDTRYWGSYITDIIKLYAEVDSGKVKSYLSQHPEVVKQNISDFEHELSYLGEKPILVALGSEAFGILNNNLGDKYQIVQIKHYSFTIGKEKYRDEVLGILDKINIVQ